MDNEGNRYLNNIAVKIDESTYVFGHLHKGIVKMVAVDSTGKTIQSRYHDAGEGAATKEKWESGSDTSIKYNVEDVSMDCIGEKF